MRPPIEQLFSTPRSQRPQRESVPNSTEPLRTLRTSVKTSVSFWAQLCRAGKLLLFAALLLSGTGLEAAPKQGCIAIASDPVGAEGFLNGNPKGQTPMKIPGLGPGEYLV